MKIDFGKCLSGVLMRVVLWIIRIARILASLNLRLVMDMPKKAMLSCLQVIDFLVKAHLFPEVLAMFKQLCLALVRLGQ